MSAWSRATAVRRRESDDPQVVEHRPRRVQIAAIVLPACSLRVRAGAERGLELAQVLDAKRSQLAPGLDQKPAEHPLGGPCADVLGEPKLRGRMLKARQIALESAARGELNEARELAVHQVVVAGPQPVCQQQERDERSHVLIARELDIKRLGRERLRLGPAIQERLCPVAERAAAAPTAGQPRLILDQQRVAAAHRAQRRSRAQP